MRLFGEQFDFGVLRNPISSIVNAVMGGHAASTAAGLIQNTDAGNANDILATTAAVAPTITGTAATGGASATQAGYSANDLINPYNAAGIQASNQLSAGLAPGGNLNSDPTVAQLQIDPGYAFRLQQGEQQLQRSAAATGGALSGGAIKSATDFAQQDASQEYQNAFNRYQTQTQNAVANLTGVANRGLTAGTSEGSNLTNAAQYAATQNNVAALNSGNMTIAAENNAANERTQASTAAAQGVLGKANAYAGGFTGFANGITSIAASLINPATAITSAGPNGSSGGYALPPNPSYAANTVAGTA